MLSRMRDFPHPFRPTLGCTQPSVQREAVRIPRGKADGVWLWPRPPRVGLVSGNKFCFQALKQGWTD